MGERREKETGRRNKGEREAGQTVLITEQILQMGAWRIRFIKKEERVGPGRNVIIGNDLENMSMSIHILAVSEHFKPLCLTNGSFLKVLVSKLQHSMP